MRRLTRLLCLLFALALIASACGGGEDEGTDEAGTEESSGGGAIDEDALDGEEEAEEGEDGEDAEEEPEEVAAPTTLEEYEALWAENRAAIVEELSSGDYGVDENNVLHGPAGFEIDLSTCPADWSDTGGIEGDTIKVGQTIAQSGNLAAYGNIAAGMEVYFDYVNANGGIDGKQLELSIKDDAYVATQTIELVDELLQSEKPFLLTTLGSPNTLAVYGTLNQSCVPHPFVQTGHPAWGDPVEHPWTTGLQMSYSTEAILWGNWIKENLADSLPVKVGGLAMDNDFGLAYGKAFAAWAEANPDVVSEYNEVKHDPAAATVTNEMTTIAAGNPDVFISMTAGQPCVMAIQEAGNNGLTTSAKALFTSSVCKDPNAYMVPAGEVANDWLIVGGGVKASTDPQYADDAFMSFLNEELEGAGLDTSVGLYGTGFGQFGWTFVESLRIAAELEGGLTRTNLMLAIRALDVNHPMTLEGISFAASGAEDAYYIEGSEFSRYDATAQSWVQEGEVIDLNGSSPNCVWTESGC